jgi:hypothetical protein
MDRKIKILSFFKCIPFGEGLSWKSKECLGFYLKSALGFWGFYTRHNRGGAG